MNYIIDPAFPWAFQKSEEFQSFQYFAESYITSLNSRRLRSRLRNKSETSQQRFLDQLSFNIAVEAWHRANELTGSREDNMLLQLGYLCTELDNFINDIDSDEY